MKIEALKTLDSDLKKEQDSSDETCAECGRIDHPAYMCWRVGHLTK